MSNITLGSLFDGAGTFPFAAQQCGVKALWASEIEPFPIAVTKKRFPEMKHLGDITKINGAEIEPVDIITFGSPCQGLSIAGKGEGLEDERSALFLEAVRIIKEMRLKTNGKYPTIAIWENVPGAFTSHKGEDFRIVLEELCKIEKCDTVIPRPPKRNGKPAWNDAGLILADGFSIAWRVLNEEFWGVPQRRKRIFIVVDFGGQCAGQVLFERDGLSRDFAESRESWKGITRPLACRSDAKVRDTRGNGDGNINPTIKGDHNNRVTDYTAVVAGFKGQNSPSAGSVSYHENLSPTIIVGQEAHVLIAGVDQYNQTLTGDKAATIDTNCGLTTGRNAVLIGNISSSSDKYFKNYDQPIFCYALDRASFNQGINAKFDIGIDESGIAHTLVAKGPGAVTYGVQIGNSIKLDLRRFTPTECGRLQGMPDWWCEDIPHKDAPEYKMWGNGMALPNVLYVMEGVVCLITKRKS